MKNFIQLLFLVCFTFPALADSNSVSEIDSLKSLLRNESESTAKADHMILLCDRKMAIHDLSQVDQYLDSLLWLSKRLNYEKGLAGYYFGVGELRYYEGKYDQALIYLNQALRRAEGLGDHALQIKVYNKLAVVNRNQGKFQEAIHLYQKAIQIAEETGNSYETANTTLSLGIIYKFQGDYSKAIELFLAGMPYFEKTGKKEVLVSLDNCIGGIYLNQKEYADAHKYLTLALEFSRELGLKSEMASNLHSIGLVYQAQQKYAEALQVGRQALDIYSEIDNKRGMERSLLAMGESYAASGNWNNALECYNKALGICEEISDNDYKSACYVGIGNILVRQAAISDPAVAAGKYDKARTCLMKALDISRLMGQKDQIMNSYHSLYQIDSATGFHKNALINFRLYAFYKDSIYNAENSHKLAQAQYRFIREQKDREIVLLTRENEIRAGEIKSQKMQRNAVLIIAAFALLLAFLIIRSFRLGKKLEKQQAVAQERERISADLHDDIGSGLSKIILMLEVLRRETMSEETREKTRAVSEESIELSKRMSEVIWALNARNDSLDSLVAYIRKYAVGYFENAAILFKMKAPANIPQVHLSSEQRRNLFFAVKEALHNVVKHAEASEVEIIVTYNDQIVSVDIRDNGVGIHSGERNRFGNGIIHMEKRMQSIGGRFEIENNHGTRIKLSLAVSEK